MPGKRGGKRPAGGAPRGPRDPEARKARIQALIAEKARGDRMARESGGMEPLDVLLYGMNYWLSRVAAEQKLITEIPPDAPDRAKQLERRNGFVEAGIKEAMAAAEAAAPYRHHKLASVKITTPPADLSRLTDQEFELYNKLCAKLTGGDVPATHAGTTAGGAAATKH